MSAPIENSKREAIVKRHEAGESLRSISETVKAIWQHWCKHGQIEPKYEQARCGEREYTVWCTKQDHRRWGAKPRPVGIIYNFCITPSKHAPVCESVICMICSGVPSAIN
jgi:hypothetical protein